MLETVLVLGILVLLAAFAVIASAITPQTMMMLGFWGLATGLAVGLPMGCWYHLVLYRAVSRQMPMPRRWWLSPAELHVHLPQEELAAIRPWFLLGGIGFMISFVGGLAAMAGLLLAG